MTLSFLPELPQIDPEKGPNLMAGAASPLWLMFGGAAMAGATWWWWSSPWREAVNLEALMVSGLAKTLPAPEPVAPVELTPEPAPEPVVEAVIDPVTEAPILAPEASEPVAVAATESVAETARETLDTAETVATETAQIAEAAAEPAVEAAKPAADDLTLLVGIGPKLAASLADLGVTRFEQIAGWGPEDLADFDAKLSLKGRAERDAWVAQAKRLAAS
jgi:predicted flap endonuclease-1-like 5' DNA nuclease